MDWMINELEIENFKSIENEKINCKRLNVFIGKPNVGKSNILEAISLLGGYNSTKEAFFSEYVRYEKVRNLFYDNDRSREILIKSNLGYFFSRYHSNNIDKYDILFGYDIDLLNGFRSMKLDDYSIDTIIDNFAGYVSNDVKKEPFIQPLYFTLTDKGWAENIRMENRFYGNIKKYDFKKGIELTGKFSSFLKPTNGENIFLLLENNPKFFDEASEIFDQYGLQLLFDYETSKLEIQKTVGKRVYKIPYSLCADTLQRYIFHLLAIKTNSKSIIILEEPEAHSFPKYISEIAGEIIADKNNQYFIATHSPYILTDFIEKCDIEDLALFICDYKDYKTIIRELTREEISNIIDTGIDLFYNLNAFQ
jgi:AAA15 family ATPase/GTPase